MGAGEQKWPLIVQAIQDVERQTDAEVRVHLSRRWLERDAERAAWKVFRREKLYETRDRNAVLIYGNLRKRKFAIVGDVGVHNRMSESGWREMASRMSSFIHEKGVDGGFAAAVAELGEKLREWYPATDSVNRLSDDVTES